MNSRATLDRGGKRRSKTALISIDDAIAQGIARIRKPTWSNEFDHLNVLPYGTPGIWTHLYCPFNKVCNKRDPVEILLFQHNRSAKDYVPYTGALPDSEEYKAAVAFFDGCLAK